MTPSSKSLYPAEFSKFLADQNSHQIVPVFPIDQSQFPSGLPTLWHGKRQPAEPIPPRTIKQWLMPWTRPALTSAQLLERKLQD